MLQFANKRKKMQTALRFALLIYNVVVVVYCLQERISFPLVFERVLCYLRIV